jgi:prolyl-tRNA synthetase
MGALIMAHSDDEGLVLPPKLAPYPVVIIPVPAPSDEVTAVAQDLMAKLKALGITAKLDTDDQTRPGWKFAEYEKLGVPVRLAIGKRDLENGTVEVARRDTKEKTSVPLNGLETYIANLLEEIQTNLYNRAKTYQQAHITPVNTWEEFIDVIENKTGFAYAHWDGTTETELKIKELTQASTRCIPLDGPQESGLCILTGKPSNQRVLFAKAY